MKLLAAGDWLAAEVTCASPPIFVFLNPEGDSPTSWGWDDSYYIGHPGYMTWIAGKTNETELAGLGNLRWLNPSGNTPAEVNYYMNQSDYAMYTGSATSSSGTLQIPAFIGIASSQTEGTGVTAEDESLLSLSDVASALGPAIGMVPIDSTPHLIGVYVPPNGTAGTSMGIYH
jgi:hypothetical protein